MAAAEWLASLKSRTSIGNRNSWTDFSLVPSGFQMKPTEVCFTFGYEKKQRNLDRNHWPAGVGRV